MIHSQVESLWTVTPAPLPDLRTYCTCGHLPGQHQRLGPYQRGTCQVTGCSCPRVHRHLRATCAGCGDTDTWHKRGPCQSASCYCPGWQEVRQFMLATTSAGGMTTTVSAATGGRVASGMAGLPNDAQEPGTALTDTVITPAGDPLGMHPQMNSPRPAPSAWRVLVDPEQNSRVNLSTTYTWDGTTKNHQALRRGDFVVFWDGRVTLGASVIDRIVTGTITACVTRCPACRKTRIEASTSGRMNWRCRACAHTDEVHPAVQEVIVPRYESRHANSWVDLAGTLTARELGKISRTARTSLTISPMLAAEVESLIASRAQPNW